MLDAVTMPCEVARQAAEDGVWTAKCSRNGEYSSVQCDTDAAECWCADAVTGEEREGTRDVDTATLACETPATSTATPEVGGVATTVDATSELVTEAPTTDEPVTETSVTLRKAYHAPTTLISLQHRA